MILLGLLLVAILVGWIILSPLLLPRATAP